jgi:hypothetical protein
VKSPLLIAALVLTLAAARAQEGQLSVPLPDGFLTLPGADGARFYALVGKKLAEGLVGDASVLFEVPAADSDRVLLLGGPLARWAHRAEDGTWSWDAAGLVLAGKLPAKFDDAYVDVLAPLDGQLEPPFDGLYPSFSSVTHDDGIFVIGVPAAGRYDLILEADGGKQRALATCTAITSDGLDKTKLAAVTTRPADFHLALTLPAALSKGKPPTVTLREVYRHMTLDASAAATRAGAVLNVPVDPRVLGGRVYAWASGWCVLRVPGSEFSEQQPAVARSVEAGRKLRLHVRDSKGVAVERACVEVRDAQGQPLVAAFDPRGEESAAILDTGGRVSAEGDLGVFGLPATGATLLVGLCGSDQDRKVIEWDGKQQELTLVVD